MKNSVKISRAQTGRDDKTNSCCHGMKLLDFKQALFSILHKNLIKTE